MITLKYQQEYIIDKQQLLTWTINKNPRCRSVCAYMRTPVSAANVLAITVHIYAAYTTVYLVISLLEIPYKNIVRWWLWPIILYVCSSYVVGSRMAPIMCVSGWGLRFYTHPRASTRLWQCGSADVSLLLDCVLNGRVCSIKSLGPANRHPKTRTGWYNASALIPAAKHQHCNRLRCALKASRWKRLLVGKASHWKSFEGFSLEKLWRLLVGMASRWKTHPMAAILHMETSNGGHPPPVYTSLVFHGLNNSRSFSCLDTQTANCPSRLSDFVSHFVSHFVSPFSSHFVFHFSQRTISSHTHTHTSYSVRALHTASQLSPQSQPHTHSHTHAHTHTHTHTASQLPPQSQPPPGPCVKSHC